MKRRTNLFYNNESDDSNFLTFSNYTEHLTGVVLATNFKIFPSRFICFNIPSLNEKYYWKDYENFENLYNQKFAEKVAERGFDENSTLNEEEFENITNELADWKANLLENVRSPKQALIEDFLVGYYENKLAYMRDKIVSSQTENLEEIKQPDDIIVYLGYLIDAIMLFDDKSEITFQSTITEQDYNGTFTDIICTICSEKGFGTKYEIRHLGSEQIIDFSKYDIPNGVLTNYLYGWAHVEKDSNEFIYVGPPSYENVLPIFDGESNTLDGKTYNIEASHRIMTLDNDSDTIAFNVIVPLYSITNMDFNTNTTILQELSTINTSITDINSHVDNVPYGIWFAGEEIKLVKDIGTNYAPSWSLLIGTQFKPFPTSRYLTQEGENNSSMGGFATYAQILARQTDIYDKLDSLYFTQKNKIDTAFDKINDQLSVIQDLYDKIDNVRDIEAWNNLKKELEGLRKDIIDGTINGIQHHWETGKQ